MKNPLWIVLTTLSTAGLMSCAATERVGKGTRTLVAHTSSKVSHFSEATMNRIRPPGVKVVEVREQDLKELPMGHERALAFENSRKRNFWIFNGPVDFNEPTLPQAGGELDGSLLPPR